MTDNPLTSWQYGPVDRSHEFFELSAAVNEHGEQVGSRKAVAFVGYPIGGVSNVQLLLLRNKLNAAAIRAVEKDLDLYLLELGEPDPWAHAHYHSSTASNVYGPVYWTAQKAEAVPDVVANGDKQSQIKMPISKASIGRIYERDIDLLLAEEFKVSDSFARWFLSQMHEPHKWEGHVVAVEISKVDNLGESDIVVLFKRHNSVSHFALFIEDKITAPFQPAQQERYRKRAQAGVQDGSYSEFLVVLCAPSAYPVASGFDARISYESLALFLRSGKLPDPRGTYRSELIASAATKTGGGWSPTDDSLTNDFWDAAYKLANDKYGELQMKKHKFTKDQSWTYFRPIEMPTRPVLTHISLKGSKGRADLNFSGILCRLFSPTIKSLLEPGMTLHQRGKSTSISIDFNAFLVTVFDESAREKVSDAFEACLMLARFYRRNKAVLDLVASQSLPDLEAPHFPQLPTA